MVRTVLDGGQVVRTGLQIDVAKRGSWLLISNWRENDIFGDIFLNNAHDVAVHLAS